MTAKTQTSFLPDVLRKPQYSGAISTLLYNWPVFSGALLFSLITLTAGVLVNTAWSWILLVGGLGMLGFVFNILAASFIVYDWGQTREYDRLAKLGNVSDANVVIDITCGKLRGTRGLLSRFQQGHYFVIDIYDAKKMPDSALRRARDMEPPLDTPRRIYQRTGTCDNLPIPQNWADVIYCSFSLHELYQEADRQAIFAQFARILKPNGKLLIAEHSRDPLNFIAFGLGVLSFFSPTTWGKHITEAGLVIQHHERWRGLVHLWVAERKLR